MQFQLIDELTRWTPGKTLTARKFLTMGEEYLGDHFPGFPVMPGVMMLQALTEASAWLWRITNDYAYSVIVMREVKGVKYGSFMKPGYCLELQTDLVRQADGQAVFKGKGTCEGQVCVSAQLTLAGYTIRQQHPDWDADQSATRDAELMNHWKKQWVLLANSSVTSPTSDTVG